MTVAGKKAYDNTLFHRSTQFSIVLQSWHIEPNLDFCLSQKKAMHASTYKSSNNTANRIHFKQHLVHIISNVNLEFASKFFKSILVYMQPPVICL